MFVYLLLLLSLFLAPIQSPAATRLGLFATAEEKALWITRMTDNVNTINGFTYQAIYNNRIKSAADAFLAQSHPFGDGYFAGYTGPNCHPDQLNSQSWPAGSGGTPFGRGNGSYLLRAAFHYFLSGTMSYANAVKTELVNLTSVPGLAWTNTTKFCYQYLQGSPNLEVMPWFFRMIQAYDWLNAGGYTGWTVGEKAAIETWLYDGAKLWAQAKVYGIQNNTQYPGIYNTPSNISCIGCPLSNLGVVYFGGPVLNYATYWAFFNQFWHVEPVIMAMGIIKNDTALITQSTKYAKAALTAGMFSSGAVPDFVRWGDCDPECVGSLWNHVTYGNMVAVADMLARTGDTSLYTFTAANTTLNSPAGTTGVLTGLDLWAKLSNKTVLLYATTSSGEQDANHLISWDAEPSGNHLGDYADFSSMVANLFYQDSDITTAMSRNALGANSNSSASACRDDQYGGCFVGGYTTWPDLPFMYGNLQGVVNPYSLTTTPSPSAPRNLMLLQSITP